MELPPSPILETKESFKNTNSNLTPANSNLSLASNPSEEVQEPEKLPDPIPNPIAVPDPISIPIAAPDPIPNHISVPTDSEPVTSTKEPKKILKSKSTSKVGPPVPNRRMKVFKNKTAPLKEGPARPESNNTNKG